MVIDGQVFILLFPANNMVIIIMTLVIIYYSYIHIHSDNNDNNNSNNDNVKILKITSVDQEMPQDKIDIQM